MWILVPSHWSTLHCETTKKACTVAKTGDGESAKNDEKIEKCHEGNVRVQEKDMRYKEKKMHT